MPPVPKADKSAAKPAANKSQPERLVLFPKLTVNGVEIPPEKLKIGRDVIDALLHWETEPEYKARCAASDDPDTQAKGEAGFGEEFLLQLPDELSGDKVRCWNNVDNRPYDPGTAAKYTQDTLDRQWAGPSMFGNEPVEMTLESGGKVKLPKFTVNGETIIVGRTGKIESGQHRLIGAKIAILMWHLDPSKYPRWEEEPWLESLIVQGTSEHPNVVRTLDNVRPRKLEDTIYTSELFRDLNGRDRKKCSNMLDAAIDLLWRRTGAGFDPAHALQTHTASFEFLDAHPRLKKAVKHLFEENKEYGITILKMSPGQCAAAMYLMASGESDPDAYAKDRQEKRLKFGLWDKAEEFFTLMANGKDRSFKHLRMGLGALKTVGEDNPGLGGRSEEKLAVLAAAWHRFRQGEEVLDEDTPVEDGGLKLSYGTDRNGNPVILDPPTFGGVDLGHNPSPPDRVTPQQAEQAKKVARDAKAKEVLDKMGGGSGTPAQDIKAQLEELHKLHPDRVLLFRDNVGDYNVFGDDAKLVLAQVGGKHVKRTDGIPMVVLVKDKFEEAVRELMGAGHKVAVSSQTADGESDVIDVQPRGEPVKGGRKPAPAIGKPKPVPPKDVKANGKAPPAKPAPKGGKREAPKLKGGIG